jgi:hypothetical protein
LFFKLKDSTFLEKKDVDEKSNLSELIDKYKLKSIYDINFISQKDLDKYRAKIDKKRGELFDKEITLGRSDLGMKKNKVINELLDYFLTTTFNKINSELNLEYTDDYYKDWEGDETIFYKWNEIPEVKMIIKYYTDILKNNFDSLILKPVSEIDIYSFLKVLSDSEIGFKYFLESYKDLLSDINYRGNSGRFYTPDLTYKLQY